MEVVKAVVARNAERRSRSQLIDVARLTTGRSVVEQPRGQAFTHYARLLHTATGRE
jgi:hypothetical protein